MSRENRTAGKRGRDPGKRKTSNAPGKAFSARDLERIEIPGTLKRREDRVLAFCHKYWTAADDPAFEKLVRDYSERFESPHYDVFRAIRDARTRKVPDDEILYRVSMILSPGYSYSVQGDLYMQRVWKALKARLSEPEAAPPTAAGSPAERPVKASDARKEIRPAGAAGKSGKAAEAPRKPPRERKRKAPASKSASAPPRSPTGSVSDRIKRLSGTRYDVFREEFLTRVRPSIDAWLDGHRAKPKGVLEDSINKAEDLVYGFLEKNYSNPYMDWEASGTRTEVEALGFDLPSLDGIIALWYERRRL